jgi:hypothetical protein
VSGGGRISNIIAPSYICHFGMIYNSIKFSSVRVEGSNLIIKFDNNGGDRNQKFSANDFIKQRIRNNQYFSLSRTGAKESLNLELSYSKNNTASKLGLSIKQQDDYSAKDLIAFLEEGKEIVIPISMLEDFDTNGSEDDDVVLKFFQRAQGTTIAITGNYSYDYSNNIRRDLITITQYNLLVAEGIPVLALRENGIIVKPNLNETLEQGTAEKIHLRTTMDNQNNYSGKGIHIIAETPGGDRLDECSIEYRKNANTNENGFYLNGIKLPDLA